MAVKTKTPLNRGVFVFLSRLCGGEVEFAIVFIDSDFLSRLCGGEGVFAVIGITHQFLSRLCGGEELKKYNAR